MRNFPHEYLVSWSSNFCVSLDQDNQSNFCDMLIANIAENAEIPFAFGFSRNDIGALICFVLVSAKFRHPVESGCLWLRKVPELRLQF